MDVYDPNLGGWFRIYFDAVENEEEVGKIAVDILVRGLNRRRICAKLPEFLRNDGEE